MSDQTLSLLIIFCIKYIFTHIGEGSGHRFSLNRFRVFLKRWWSWIVGWICI